MMMNSTDNSVIAQQNTSPWRVAFTRLTDWVKALDYSAYEHTSVTISELAESISMLEKRVIELKRFEQKSHNG
jgi:hypothetical protein